MLAGNRNTPENILKLLYDINCHRPEVVEELCRNKNASAGMLDEILDWYDRQPNAHKGFDVPYLVGLHRNTTTITLRKLVEDYVWSFKNFNPVTVNTGWATFVYDPDNPFDQQRHIVTVARENLRERATG